METRTEILPTNVCLRHSPLSTMTVNDHHVQNMQTIRTIHTTANVQTPVSHCFPSLHPLHKIPHRLLLLLLFSTLILTVCDGLVTSKDFIPLDYPTESNEFKTARAVINPLSSPTSIWENSTIPYSFDKAFPLRLKRQSIKAMCLWMKQTHCVRFVERTNETFFISFEQNTGDAFSCTSFVGKLRYYKDKGQPLRLGIKCRRGNIIHELGHALGFYHEHQRSDRDDYVFINYTNIPTHPVILAQFAVKENSISLGSVYDYASVMHYPLDVFSNNTQNTIVPLLPYSGIIGQRKGLSDIDKIQSNDIYKCYNIGANNDLMPPNADIILDGDWIILSPLGLTNYKSKRVECNLANCTVNRCAGKLFKNEDVTKCPGNLIKISKIPNEFDNDRIIRSGSEVVLQWDIDFGPSNEFRSLFCEANGSCSLSPIEHVSLNEVSLYACYQNIFTVNINGKNATEDLMHYDQVTFQRTYNTNSKEQLTCTENVCFVKKLPQGVTSDTSVEYSFLLQKY